MSDDTKTMRLPCKLTDDEVKERAHEAAELMLEIDTEEEAEADRKREAKALAETKKRKLRELSRSVRERAEHRLTEIEEIPRVAHSTMEIVRRDTGEVVYSRPMTDGERRAANQGALWVEPVPTVRVSTAEHP